MDGLASRGFLLVALLLTFCACRITPSHGAMHGHLHHHHRHGHHLGFRGGDVFKSTMPLPGTPLYFRPESAGIFSIFVQLRVSYRLAQLHRRPLVIELSSYRHFGRELSSACNWFVVPSTIRCVDLGERTPCLAVDAFHYNMTHGPICWEIYSYADYLGNTSARAVTIEGAGLLEPPFKLAEHYQAKARAFLQRLNPSNASYTVVHWRRGDQLVTRCANYKDLSVNCASPRDFVNHVRSMTNDSIVYVATNERNQETLQYLREHNLFTFSSVMPVHNESRPTQFAIEVWLMQFADRFLGWGVSEVNDVIESDRRQRGLSYCLGQRAVDTNASYYGVSTWCMSIRPNQLV